VIDLRTPTAAPGINTSQARGSYDETHQILIDNMTDAAGHAGYFVITPFALVGGGWLLVNRGWVPVGAARAVLPQVAVTSTPRRISGRADHLPTPGIHMGSPAPLQGPFPVVATFPTHSDIERLLSIGPWSAATDLVLLDADQPDGYVRQWQPPGMPPLRHVAYAVQWFGLALALGVIYLVTNLKPSPRPA
jgi:surfeit locus 1 family protein